MIINQQRRSSAPPRSLYQRHRCQIRVPYGKGIFPRDRQVVVYLPGDRHSHFQGKRFRQLGLPIQVTLRYVPDYQDGQDWYLLEGRRRQETRRNWHEYHEGERLFHYNGLLSPNEAARAMRLDSRQQQELVELLLVMHAARRSLLPVRYVQRDRDTKYAKSFDAKLKSLRVKVLKNPIRAPNTNAFVERFVQSIQSECLDHFIAFGEKHLNHLCAEYLAHEDRPHQGLDNEPLTTPKARGQPRTKQVAIEDQVVPLADVRCKQRLGGLLKSYSRRAA